MFSPDQYQLLDFGEGRKLERFADLVIDRPAPVADGLRKSSPERWSSAAFRFDRERSRWVPQSPGPWSVRHSAFAFHLTGAQSGQVGLFPEQALNWQWIEASVRSFDRPLKVLNLFAYTGGSTLAAAAAGAEVVHIDAVSSAVDWARRNAELSGLAARPIRWITEDAVKFVERELRRGNRYDAIILDPPSYGHGAGGRAWKLEADLAPLLRQLVSLTADRLAFILLSCHTVGYEADQLARLLRSFFGAGAIESGDMSLVTERGRKLPAGHFARWSPRA